MVTKTIGKAVWPIPKLKAAFGSRVCADVLNGMIGQIVVGAIQYNGDGPPWFEENRQPLAKICLIMACRGALVLFAGQQAHVADNCRQMADVYDFYCHSGRAIRRQRSFHGGVA